MCTLKLFKESWKRRSNHNQRQKGTNQEKKKKQKKKEEERRKKKKERYQHNSTVVEDNTSNVRNNQEESHNQEDIAIEHQPMETKRVKRANRPIAVSPHDSESNICSNHPTRNKPICTQHTGFLHDCFHHTHPSSPLPLPSPLSPPKQDNSVSIVTHKPEWFAASITICPSWRCLTLSHWLRLLLVLLVLLVLSQLLLVLLLM